MEAGPEREVTDAQLPSIGGQAPHGAGIGSLPESGPGQPPPWPPWPMTASDQPATQASPADTIDFERVAQEPPGWPDPPAGADLSSRARDAAVADQRAGATPPPPRRPTTWLRRHRLHLGVAAALTAIVLLAGLRLATAAHPIVGSATLPMPGTTQPAASGGPQSSAANGGLPGGADASVGGRTVKTTNGSAGPNGLPTPAGTATNASPGIPGIPDPSVPPAPSPTRPAQPALTASYLTTSRTGPGPIGYHVVVSISNPGNSPLTGWQVVFGLLPGQSVSKVAGVEYHQYDTQVTFTPKGATSTVNPGQTQSFKFDVAGSAEPPTGCTINGWPCG